MSTIHVAENPPQGRLTSFWLSSKGPKSRYNHDAIGSSAHRDGRVSYTERSICLIDGRTALTTFGLGWAAIGVEWDLGGSLVVLRRCGSSYFLRACEILSVLEVAGSPSDIHKCCRPPLPKDPPSCPNKSQSAATGSYAFTPRASSMAELVK